MHGAGFLRMLTIDGTTDVLSVRTINVTNGTLTDDGDGVVTLDTGGAETLERLDRYEYHKPFTGKRHIVQLRGSEVDGQQRASRAASEV